MRAVSREHMKSGGGRKDYTRAITLIVAGALCSAFWIAAVEAVVHAVRR